MVLTGPQKMLPHMPPHMLNGMRNGWNPHPHPHPYPQLEVKGSKDPFVRWWGKEPMDNVDHPLVLGVHQSEKGATEDDHP